MLKIGKKKKPKEKKRIEKWETKAMAVKYCRDKRGIILFNKEK